VQGTIIKQNSKETKKRKKERDRSPLGTTKQKGTKTFFTKESARMLRTRTGREGKHILHFLLSVAQLGELPYELSFDFDGVTGNTDNTGERES